MDSKDMRPFSMPCGCIFSFYDLDDKGDERWESELCDFHKSVMEDYLTSAQ
jgi:hypothetical protein